MEDDLRLRVLGMNSGASAGPLLRSFLSLAAFAACDCLSSLIIGLRSAPYSLCSLEEWEPGPCHWTTPWKKSTQQLAGLR